MKTDGEKKKGRYFKRSSTLMEKISVESYSFSEICRNIVTYPDNPNSNIFRKRFHDQEDFDASIHRPNSFFQNLLDANMRPSVIFPRDFTSDWMEEKRKAKRRNSSRYEDEDEFEMALEAEEEERIKTESTMRGGPPQNKSAEKPQESAPASSKKEENEGKEAPKLQVQEHHLEDLQSPQKVKPSSLEDMGRAIQDFVKPVIDPLSTPERVQPPNPSRAAPDSSPVAEGKTPAAEQGPPESSKLDESALAEMKDKAYAEGFKKGLDDARDQLEKAIASTNGGLGKLDELRKEILDKAQENFYEIAKALCESILEREIKLNPSALADLIAKVSKQLGDTDEFTIKVSPQDLSVLQKLGLPGFEKKWRADEKIQPGNFVIEAKDQALRSSIKDIVSGLLNEADLQLFEKEPDKGKDGSST